MAAIIWTPLLGAVSILVYIEFRKLMNHDAIAQIYAAHTEMAVIRAL